MVYRYKKEFLRDFFYKKKMKKKDLMHILDTSSANNVNVWLLERAPLPLKEGQKDTGDREWLPLRCIIYLLNRFPELRISDFIEGVEDPPQIEKVKYELEYQRNINKLCEKNRDREDHIRAQYEQKIAQYERKIEEFQHLINELVERIPKRE